VSLDDLTSGSADAGSGDASLEAGDASISDATTTDANSNSDGGDGSAIFLDDFNRPDAALIGNGWIEKRPIEFSLGDDQVVRGPVDGFDYPDNMVYRPAAEDIESSEISVELTFQSSVTGFPQIHSRIQEDTIIQAGTVDSYVFAINANPTQAMLARTRGAENITPLATINLAETLTPGERYRLSLRVTSVGTVSVFGLVEHFESGTWTMIGQGTAQDSDPMRLDDAGSVGFSCSANDSDLYHFDNFMRTPM
jgi:hypothetical protein